jgi:hypothetical protein
MKHKCEHCRWWSGNMHADIYPIYGDCRISAPNADVEGAALWPSTGADDWCGKFEARDDRAARLLGTKYMAGADGEAA